MTKRILISILFCLLTCLQANAQILQGVMSSASAPAWIDNTTGYRRAGTISNSSNSNVLSNYAVPVALTSANFTHSACLTDGSDIRVTASDGTTVIPWWNQTAGLDLTDVDGTVYHGWSKAGQTGTVWVKPPSIPGSGSLTVYIYYGNASPTPVQIPPLGPFAMYGSNPVLGAGHGINTPKNIIYDSGTSKYWMVFDDGANSRIGFMSATTPMGAWTVSPNYFTPAAFTSGGCGWVKSGSTWYLYYCNGKSATTNTVEYATSTTGPDTGYTHQGTSLSCGGAGAWDHQWVGEVYVAQLAGAYGSFSAGTWLMVFEGNSSATLSAEQVGFATASSPAGPWTKYGSNPVLTYGAANSYDASMLSDPSFYELNSKLYIFYTCSRVDPTNSAFFASNAYATTTDLSTFKKGTIIQGRGNSGAWDSDGRGRGSISYDSANNLYYYTFSGGSAQGGALYSGISSMSSLSTAAGYPPEQVLSFFDDFSGNYPASHYALIQEAASGGSLSLSGGIGTLTAGSSSGSFFSLYTMEQFGPGYVLAAYTKHSTADNSHIGFVGFAGGAQTPGNNSPAIYINDGATIGDGKWTKNSQADSSHLLQSDMAQAVDTTAYHHHRIFWNSASNVQFQNDNNALETISTAADIPGGTVPLTVQAFNATASATNIPIDYMFVRPYSSPAPSASLGAQQSK